MELTKLSEEALNRPPEDVFDILHQIGKGSYGSVYKSIHKESRQVVAIKKVPFDLQDMIKEISIMQQCDSPYVVKYYGTYFKGSELWIVMEFCGAGSILDIMKLRGRSVQAKHLSRPQVKTFNEKEIATVFHGTLKGLEYLHLRKKIHRDIKAGNILLTSEGNAKLADFGVAAQLNNTVAKRFTSIGTPLWMAPEVIQEIGYDCVADIWSLGITALEMSEGKVPYMEMHPVRAMFMIPGKPPPSFSEPDKWSTEFIEFVSKCLVKNPEKRATATELLKDEFIQNMAKSSDILVPIIAEAQQIRDTIQESTLDNHDSESEDLDKTLVEESNSIVIARKSNSQNGEIPGCGGTMIQHSTFPTTEKCTPNKDVTSLAETCEVNGIYSKIETMLINDEQTTNHENVRTPIGAAENIEDVVVNVPREDSGKVKVINKSNCPGTNLPKNAANKKALDLCDIEIAEQLYMNSNMIPRNLKKEENIYSNLPLKEDKMLQEMFSTGLMESNTLKEGPFKFNKCLSTTELKSKLQNLDKEMELEIEKITRRYHIKRQPILDGIDEKRKHQQNF